MPFKKKLYIGTFLLTLIGLFLQIQFERSDLHDALKDAGYFIMQLEVFLNAAIRLFSIGALAALCIVQMKKETPKLLMLTCGAVLFTSIQDIILEMVVPGAFLAAAALLPLIFILTTAKPKKMLNYQQHKPLNRLLVAAGILSFMTLIGYTYNYYRIVVMFSSERSIPTWVYIIPLIYMALDIGKILTCLIYTKKKSLHLRMLFFGTGVWNAIVLPVSACITIFLSLNTAIEKVLNLSLYLFELATIILVIMYTHKMHKIENTLQPAQIN